MEPVRDAYRYALALYKDDLTHVGDVAVRPDWEPAAQWAQWHAARRGLLPPFCGLGPCAVRPVWHAEHGEPYVAAFRLDVFDDEGRPAASSAVATDYMLNLARQASSRFVEQGVLKDGELFRYVVCAFPRREEAEGGGEPRTGFVVRSERRAMELARVPLAALLEASSPAGVVHADDMPVVVGGDVLDEALALAREAGANETGGVLIGHLRRDVRSPEIVAEVGAQIPARHSRPELSKLTFTADTWAAVRAVLGLRRDGSIMLGWWHSHSYMKETCKDCAKRRDGTCSASAAFMSAEDCALHRTVFPAAWSVALVGAESPCDGASYAMFGWRRGVVRSRGFHVRQAGAAEPACVAQEGGNHAD